MKPPHPPLVLRVVRSSGLVWLFVRVMYAFVMIAGAMVSGMLSLEQAIHYAKHPMWPTRLLLVVLTAALVHLDRKLAHEHLLQANFGVPAFWFSATSFVVAGLSDVIVQALILLI